MDEETRQAVHINYLIASIHEMESEAMKVSERESEFMARPEPVERQELSEIFDGQRYIIRMFGNTMTTLLYREIGTRPHPAVPEVDPPGIRARLKARVKRLLR